MNILQSIFTDYYEHIVYDYTLVLPSSKMSTRRFIVVTLLMAVSCMVAPTVVISNLSPSDAKAASDLPAVINTIRCVPFKCPASLFLAFTDIAYLQFLKNYAFISCATTLYWVSLFSVRDVVLRMFSDMNKKENFTPCFICVLHTFGRDLKWNPHIHALISEGATDNITPWRPVKHFNYTFLRNALRKVLLEKMTSAIGSSFRKVKNDIYKNHSEGFYVRTKPNLCPP